MGAAGLLTCLLLTAVLSSAHAGLVRKVLRHRRQASPEDQNLTFPTAGRPVVFNHVYNVNVPVSSLCSVDLDSPESVQLQPEDATLSSGHQTTEHTVDGENQIVFTHRINIPRQACGCADDLSLLKDLVSRLEMLEGEVSALRDQCNGDRACCSAQATGKVGTKPFCNGHGNYSTDTCGCVCEPGWKGTSCSEPECPANCQGRGRCINGTCDCLEGFAGDDCAQKVCPVDCGAKRQCVSGVCVCLEGFYGVDCSESKCPNDCRARGRCVNGTCHCKEGYAGKDCGEPACPSGCHGNGFCVHGRCECVAGFGGKDCSQLMCLNGCNGRGACFHGVCICETGYHGEDCSQLACLNNCNSRGQCINGQCACDVGFQGDDCAELSCPNNCRHRGRCVNGQCVCEEGFAGEDCRIEVCPSNCYGRGECAEGRCVCHTGFAGEDCGHLSCPNGCRNRGRCIDGQCVCDEGFAGEDCGQEACPNDCLARGHCAGGKCVCQEGYTGDDCSVLICPMNCNNRGRCSDGRCRCESGYQGESCAERSCLNGCQDRGQCVNGRCICDEGYAGEDCSEVSPPKDLTVDEVTRDTVALSWGNDMLVTEYLVTYVPTSPGGLQQEFTVSGDRTAATVKELEPGLEYLIKVYAVLSNKRSVPVSARVATVLPQPEGLIFKSVRETSVEVVWDQLDVPFDGWEIYFRNTKEENGEVVSTLPPTQNQFTQSGLGPGQEYEVSISVIKNNTRGPKTSRTVTTKIDGPRQLEVKDVTDSSALVSWSQSAAPTDKVAMFYGPSSDPSGETAVEIFPPDTQCSIDGLRPDTEYKVSLVSRSGDVASDPVTTTFTTALDAPVGLQAVSQTDGSITLEWTNGQAEGGAYRVKYSPISGATHGEELFPRGPGDATKATITGLEPGTEYGIGVTAVRNERESLPATINAATDIDPPREFRDVASTDTSLTLRWQKPRAKVGAYRLVRVSEDGRAEEEEIPGSQTSVVLSRLTPGTSYSVTVTAERGPKRSAPVTLSASTGSEDNVFSFVHFDSPEPRLSTAPDSTSPDVLSLGIVDSPVTPRSALDTEAAHSPNPLRPPGTEAPPTDTEAPPIYAEAPPTVTEAPPVYTDAPPTDTESPPTDTEAPPTETEAPPTDTEAPVTSGAGVMSSESESSRLGLPDDLTLSVTSASINPPRTAPGEAFHSVSMVSAPPGTTQAHVTTLPGSARRDETEGLSPSSQTDITLEEKEGRRSLPLSDFAATEAPQPGVTNLTISDITWDGFTASWTPVGGDFDSFVFEVTNLDNLAESQNLTLSGGALSLGVSGLNPNTTYMVGLYGMHQGSFLEPLYTDATTATQPVVGKLFISNLTSESFSIVWNGTEGDLDGYILEIIDSDWLMEPKEYNVSRTVKSHEVTGLRPSTDYVAFLYGTLKGSRSGAVSIVASTAEEPDLSGLVVSNVTSDRFSLSWRTGEKVFDNFIVEVRESALPSQAMGRALPGDVRSTVMAGLKASTSYDIKLYASAGGQSAPPLFDVATTEDVPLLGPVAASSVSPHDLSLSWSTVSGHFDGFVIRVSDPGQQSDPLEFRPPGDARNITVSNLMDATGYDIEVYGISHGRHTPSVLAHVVTAPLPKVENLTISNITPYGFRVSWEVKQQQQQQQEEEEEEEDLLPTSGGFSHFHIVVTDSGWLLEPQEFTVPGNQSHLDMWGLITGIGYEVRLTGVSESGLLSRPLTTVAVTEAEPEVEHLFVSDVTADGFRLSWTCDEDMFDRFVIRIRDGKRLAHPREYSAPGDERTRVFTGLMSGTEYEIELYGVTLDQRSQPITGVVQTGLSTPKGLHFSGVTDSSAVVHWSSPRSPVDGYRVTYLPFEGGSPVMVTVDGGVFEASLSNMIPGKTYQVTVSSVKGLEESDPSSDTVTTALDRPRGLTALNVTDTSALLLWQPSVAAVDGYVITYGADSASPTVAHVPGNTVEFEMSSLQPGTHHQVGVHAVKEALRSDSAVTEFTTDVDPPRDLTAVNIQTDSATLTWKHPQAAITGYTLTFSSSDGTIREVVLSPTASSYNMAPLTATTRYDVRLQAVVGAQRSRHVNTVFSTTGHVFGFPEDCAQVLLNGETTSDLYTIYVGGEESQPLQVFCDMTTDGGGWTVFLRRQNGKMEFYRNWKNYTAGFGDLRHEFWLGLTNLHKITNSGHYELRVDLRDEGESAYAQYDRFTVAEPRTRYKIYVGAYSGTAGDSLTYHQGRPFSTYDNDNDIAVTNCALSYKGAFWYKNCHRVNLMGKYGDGSHSKGINWFHWRGHEHSIQFAEMKMRPADFRNFESRKKRS